MIEIALKPLKIEVFYPSEDCYRVHTSYLHCLQVGFTPSNSPLQRGRTQVSPLCKGGLRGVNQDFHLLNEICVLGR